MNDYQNICESARLKTVLLQEQISKKILVDREFLFSLQEDLKKSKQKIEKLTNDKLKLKHALMESISKRDIHYKQYLYYKSIYHELKDSQAIQSPKSSSHQEKKAYQEKIELRDKKIKELYHEIQKLEEKLMKKEVDLGSWKDLYNASQYINSETSAKPEPDFSRDIKETSERVLSRIKREKPLYHAFKEACNCSKYFSSLIERQFWDEALFKLLGYLELLLTNFKIENLSQRTPSFSPHIHIRRTSSDLSNSYNQQISIINPEISLTKENALKDSEKSPKITPKNRLKIPRVNRVIKSESENSLNRYL